MPLKNLKAEESMLNIIKLNPSQVYFSIKLFERRNTKKNGQCASKRQTMILQNFLITIKKYMMF